MNRKNHNQTIELKDGSVLTLRGLEEADQERLAAFNDGLSKNSRRLFTPHAYDYKTVTEYIDRHERGDDFSYVAVANDDRIVAYFFLWKMNEAVPLLGIGITDELQGKGLGKRLMRFLIDVAKRQGKSGIDLTTMQDNDRAYALYQSVGFEYKNDVSNVAGDGRVITERRMFLPLIEGAEPPNREFGPPV